MIDQHRDTPGATSAHTPGDTPDTGGVACLQALCHGVPYPSRGRRDHAALGSSRYPHTKLGAFILHQRILAQQICNTFCQANRYLGGCCPSQRLFPSHILPVLLCVPRGGGMLIGPPHGEAGLGRGTHAPAARLCLHHGTPPFRGDRCRGAPSAAPACGAGPVRP
jgi:hypothetical protein